LRSPHTCAISVALLDQGEIVPARGTMRMRLALVAVVAARLGP
jgi:hypothetical protein